MKKRIKIRRRDDIRQHYWIGKRLRKNYGSKMFREQIKKELDFTVPSNKEIKSDNKDLLDQFSYSHRDLVRKINNQTTKDVTPSDIIRFIEKNPEYYKPAKKVKWMTKADPLEFFESGNLGGFSAPDDTSKQMWIDPEKPRIVISTLINQKENVPKIIRHELEHYKQFEEFGQDKFNKLVDKGIIVDKDLEKKGFNIVVHKPWKDRPIEKDVLKRTARLTERQKARWNKSSNELGGKPFRQLFK